jgi:RNA polymerase sigma-70 factor (ECF subfamily)
MRVARDRGRRSSGELDRLGDEELLELVAGGDARAVERIYDRHSRVAYSLAYRILGASMPAQDAVQESFLAVWRTSGGYRATRGSARNWILGIVHHRAIDAVRRAAVPGRAVARDGTERDTEAPERTETEVERREDARAVRSALDGLPADQRRVIELAYYGGFTHTEISELLGEALGTIKGRMRLGLEKLRGALEPSQETR